VFNFKFLKTYILLGSRNTWKFLKKKNSFGFRKENWLRYRYQISVGHYDTTSREGVKNNRFWDDTVYGRPLMLTCIIKRWQVKICVAYYATLDPVWQDHLSKGSAIALVGPFQDLKKNAPMHPASLCPGYCNGSEVGPAGLYYCFYSITLLVLIVFCPVRVNS
jgi:hypothetical protein